MLSDDVVIMRSRPTISIKHKTEYKLPNNLINPEDGSFEVGINMSLETGISKPIMITINFTSIDSRTELDTSEYQVTLETGDVASSLAVTINPKLPNFGVDKTKQNTIPDPLEFKFKTSWTLASPLISDCQSDSLVECPVLDPRDGLVTTTGFFVQLQMGCADNARCDCNLGLEKSDETQMSVPAVKDENVVLVMTISNTGTEPAYNSRLVVYPDLNVPIIQSPGTMSCFNSTKIGDNQVSITCDLMPLEITSRRVGLSFSIGQILKQKLTHEFGVRVVIATGCRVSSDSLETEFQLSYHFKPHANLATMKDQFNYDEDDIDFESSFEVSSQGTTVSDKLEKFKIFIPKSDEVQMKSLETSGQGGVAHCDLALSTSKFSRGEMPDPKSSHSNLISCSTGECQIYQCSVYAGWNPKSRLRIDLKLRFVAQKALEVADETERLDFEVWTHLEMSNQFITSQIEFLSNVESDKLTPGLVGWLPIILGGAIVILVVGVLLYVMYRTNALKKLRFYRDQLEEEEKMFERKASVVKSRTLPQQAKIEDVTKRI